MFDTKHPGQSTMWLNWDIYEIYCYMLWIGNSLLYCNVAGTMITEASMINHECWMINDEYSMKSSIIIYDSFRWTMSLPPVANGAIVIKPGMATAVNFI